MLQCGHRGPADTRVCLKCNPPDPTLIEKKDPIEEMNEYVADERMRNVRPALRRALGLEYLVTKVLKIPGIDVSISDIGEDEARIAFRTKMSIKRMRMRRSACSMIAISVPAIVYSTRSGLPEVRSETDMVDGYIGMFINLVDSIKLADKKGFDTVGFMVSRTYRDKVYDSKLERWTKSTKDKAPIKAIKKVATVAAGALIGTLMVALV